MLIDSMSIYHDYTSFAIHRSVSPIVCSGIVFFFDLIMNGSTHKTSRNILSYLNDMRR
jgi:hypothetical protein